MRPLLMEVVYILDTNNKKQTFAANKARSKPVIAINSLGEERKYSSGRAAAKDLGIAHSGVTYCLSGKRKTSGGYRFRYVDEN